MGSPKSRRRFRNYLVKRDLQLRGIFYNMIFLLIVALITLITALSPMLQKMTASYDIEVQYYAAATLLSFLKRWTPVMVFVLVIFIAHQLLLTHRICGPLINFMRTIKGIAKGDLTRRCSIRKADFLGEECNEINQMMNGLIELLSEAQMEGENLYTLFESEKPLYYTQEELESTLQLTKEKVDGFKKALSTFKIETHSD